MTISYQLTAGAFCQPNMTNMANSTVVITFPASKDAVGLLIGHAGEARFDTFYNISNSASIVVQANTTGYLLFWNTITTAPLTFSLSITANPLI